MATLANSLALMINLEFIVALLSLLKQYTHKPLYKTCDKFILLNISPIQHSV